MSERIGTSRIESIGGVCSHGKCWNCRMTKYYEGMNDTDVHNTLRTERKVVYHR